jgi:peptidylprolyl isomerase
LTKLAHPEGGKEEVAHPKGDKEGIIGDIRIIESQSKFSIVIG